MLQKLKQMKTIFLNKQKQKEAEEDYKNKRETILYNLYSLNTEQAINLFLEVKTEFDAALNSRLESAKKEQQDIENYLQR